MSEEREPLGEEALAEMAEEIGYREKRFAASPAESFTRDAELQWMTAYASRLLAEVGRQRERTRALEGALAFYAEEDNWEWRHERGVSEEGLRWIKSTAPARDGGEHARAVLFGEAPEEKGGSE